MKTSTNLKKITFKLPIFVILFGVFFTRCAKDEGIITPTSEPEKVLADKTSYQITVSASAKAILVGQRFTFEGQVLNGRRPVANLYLGIYDPMKEKFIPNAAKTDSKGNFKYTPDASFNNLSPVLYNDMQGIYSFSFTAGSSTVKSQVVVNHGVLKEMGLLTITNSGKFVYRVKIAINQVNMGTYTLLPGCNPINMISAKKFADSRIDLTIMNSSNKILWTTQFLSAVDYQKQYTAYINPCYNNYHVQTIAKVSDKSIVNDLNKLDEIFEHSNNIQFDLGLYSVVVENTIRYGLSNSTNLLMEAPGCVNFFGFREKCKIYSNASMGLEMAFSINTTIPFQLYSKLSQNLKYRFKIGSTERVESSAAFFASSIYQ